MPDTAAGVGCHIPGCLHRPCQEPPHIWLSPYAMQHSEHYGLRPRTWYGGKVVRVELALMDANGDFIDEDGCNCDLDSPCNNPKCVMERGWYW